MIGVILPSRGLIFSETADEILQNLKGIPHKIYFAHGLPIPDCFEEPVERALKDKVSHIWLVEDDMVLPSDTLQILLDMDVACVTVDYPTVKNGGGAMFKVKGQVIFGGTGCTLVKAEVFKELKKPYFTTDICWNIKNFGDHIRIIGVPRAKVNDGYGLHDVNFFMNLNRLEIPIHDGGFTLSQRKLKSLGKVGSNNGAHKIEVWKKIKKDDLLKKVMSWPVEVKGNLATVLINDKEILTSPEHAKKLLKLGKAIKPPRKAVVIDESEVL